MNKLLRGLIAGYGAKKLGTGCFSTILIFVLIWIALGQCEGPSLGEDNTRHRNKTRFASVRLPNAALADSTGDQRTALSESALHSPSGTSPRR